MEVVALGQENILPGAAEDILNAISLSQAAKPSCLLLQEEA